MEPRGRSGWLAILIFCLSASSLVVVVSNLAPIFEADKKGAIWPSGFKLAFYASVFVPALILLYTAWTLIKRNDKSAVYTAIKWMWVGVIGVNFAPNLTSAAFFPSLDVTQELLRASFSSALSLSIWTAYLLKSKRVQNTYVEA